MAEYMKADVYFGHIALSGKKSGKTIGYECCPIVQLSPNAIV